MVECEGAPQLFLQGPQLAVVIGPHAVVVTGPPIVCHRQRVHACHDADNWNMISWLELFLAFSLLLFYGPNELMKARTLETRRTQRMDSFDMSLSSDFPPSHSWSSKVMKENEFGWRRWQSKEWLSFMINHIWIVNYVITAFECNLPMCEKAAEYSHWVCEIRAFLQYLLILFHPASFERGMKNVEGESCNHVLIRFLKKDALFFFCFIFIFFL